MGPPGEDHHARVVVGDGLERRGAGDAEGEDGEAPDAAGDEVGVLGAVVEDEHEVGLDFSGVHLGGGVGGGVGGGGDGGGGGGGGCRVRALQGFSGAREKG